MKAGNNKGYSLVELLLAIFILALVMAGVVSIMRATSVSYRNGNFEVNVQTEAQIVANQIEELLVDADTSVSYNSSTGVYTIVNRGVSHQLKYDSSESTIQYQSGSSGWSLMAEYVDGFSIDGISTNSSEVACDNKVTVNVTMNNQGYKYTAVKDVYFRNAIENSSVQLLNGAGASTSSSTSENVVYVNVERYDIIDLVRDYDFNVSTLTRSSELASDYEFVTVTYNTDTSNHNVSSEIAAITVPADASTTTGFIRTNNGVNGDWSDSVGKDENRWIKGATNTGASIKLVFYTEAVSFELKNAGNMPISSGYAVLLTTDEPGTGEKYIASIDPKGVDLGMMLITTTNKIHFGYVAYDDADSGAKANQQYDNGEGWHSCTPSFYTISDVGMSNAKGNRMFTSPDNWWLTLKVGVDEESGNLVLHQNEQLGAGKANAMSEIQAGDKRVAVLLYIDNGANNDEFSSRTCTVLDFNLCYQGASFDAYKGGNVYTRSMSNWGATTYPASGSF